MARKKELGAWEVKKKQAEARVKQGKKKDK